MSQKLLITGQGQGKSEKVVFNTKNNSFSVTAEVQIPESIIIEVVGEEFLSLAV